MPDTNTNQSQGEDDVQGQQGDNQSQYARQGAQGHDPSVKQYGSRDGQGEFGDQGSEPRYSYMGPHGEYADEDTAPDSYGPQDQFGDLDDQDPYSNLEDEDPGSSTGGEGLYDVEGTLYGLAEPLAEPGEKSTEGKNKDQFGTRGSQDQYGYQK